MNSSVAAIPRSPGRPAVHGDFHMPFDLAQQQAALSNNQQQQQKVHQQQQQQQNFPNHEQQQGNVERSFSRGRGLSNDGVILQNNFNSSSSKNESQGSVAAIDRIGSLLDRVTDLAQTARMSFIEGDHAQSSLCLGDLQRSLTEIGELGTQSLAEVEMSDALHNSQNQAQAQHLETIPPSTLGHRRNLTESALKKRPLTVTTHDVDFTPFKTMRAQDGTPVNHPPLPPPSAPPMSFEGMSSAATSTPSTNAPVPPPSAPPYFNPSAPDPGSMSAPQTANPISSIMSNLQTTTSSSSLSSSISHQQQQQQQQAIQDLFNSTSQGGINSINQSPVTTQGSFGFNFNGSMGSSHNSMGQSTPPTPNIGGFHSTRSSMNGSMISDATGNTSHSLQMAFQSSMPPSPQEKMNGPMDGYNSFDTSHRRLVSSSGRNGQIGASNGKHSLTNDTPSGEEGQEGSLLSSERGMSGAHVSPDLKSSLDSLFFDFLERVCSDVNFSDGKGEHLHQILTAKKMSRSSLATESYKAFKFRIQAFTNAFHEEVEVKIGVEKECSLKQTRAYLWTSNYIARFNESGVKEKSKGNHVWRVEARKNKEGKFEFREFKRKIIVPTQVAYHGISWTWPLRIWDPQAPSTSIKAVFGAQNLPSWIQWKDGDYPILYGTPDASCQSCQLHITAHYVARGHQQLVRLSATVDLQVEPLLDQPDSKSVGESSSGGEDTSMQIKGLSGDQVMSSIQDSEQTMEEIRLDQAASVMAPAQMAQVLSQMNLPYTPPASFGQQPQFFMSNDNNGEIGIVQQPEAQKSKSAEEKEVNIIEQSDIHRQPLPSAPLPLGNGPVPSLMQPHEQIQHNQIRDLMARQEQAAATMQLNMPTMRRRLTDHQLMDQARSIRAQAVQQQQQLQDQVARLQATQQQQHQTLQQTSQEQHQQQQHQAMAEATSDLLMMQQQGQQLDSLANNGQATSIGMYGSKSGAISDLNLTPMSSMPQMASTLPHMTAGNHDPMLSPALPMGFDPIANEGARIMAMQQQDQQKQQEISQQQTQNAHQQHHV